MKPTDKRFWIFETFVAFVSVGVGYTLGYVAALQQTDIPKKSPC